MDESETVISGDQLMQEEPNRIKFFKKPLNL